MIRSEKKSACWKSGGLEEEGRESFGKKERRGQEDRDNTDKRRGFKKCRAIQFADEKRGIGKSNLRRTKA